MALIDFQKAFDTLEHWAIMESLANARIDSRYLEIIYKNATCNIQLNNNMIPINIERDIRQGDTESPNLFISTFEDIFNRPDWQDKCILINGKGLNHLRYADDIVLASESGKTLKLMLKELEETAAKIGTI